VLLFSRLSLLLVVLATAVACASPTAPEPLRASLEPVSLASEQAWPSVPVISGGSSIRIRGMAQAGCGYLHAEATRRAADVAVTITSKEADRPCVATTPAWQPFSVLIHVEPGAYQVRVSAVGHTNTARAAVSVH